MPYAVKRTINTTEGFNNVKNFLGNQNAKCFGIRDYDSDYMYFAGSTGKDARTLIVNKKSGAVNPYEKGSFKDRAWKPVLNFGGALCMDTMR